MTLPRIGDQYFCDMYNRAEAHLLYPLTYQTTEPILCTITEITGWRVSWTRSDGLSDSSTWNNVGHHMVPREKIERISRLDLIDDEPV